MRAPRLFSLLVAGGLLAGVPLVHAQQQALPATDLGGGAIALDNAFQELYKVASPALVRVSVTQSAAAVLTPELKGQFDDWRRNNNNNDAPGRGGGGGGGGGGRGGGRGGTSTQVGGRNDGRGNDFAGGMPGGPGGPGGLGGFGRGGFNPNGISGQVGAFLRWKIDQQNKMLDTVRDRDREPIRQQIASLRGLLVRADLARNGLQGEMTAIVIDAQGHALMLSGLLREAHEDSLPVTLPSGKETTAKFVGASLYGGFSVIKLASVEGVRPVSWAKRRLMPWQLLVAVSANQVPPTPIIAASRTSSGAMEEHLALPPDERGGLFLFDSAGNLTVALTGGGWQADRRALYGDRILRDIQYIIGDGTAGRDIVPRPLGLSFSPDTIAVRRGVIVTNVDDRSPAREAGIKKDDVLVSIDGRPVLELVSSEGPALRGLIEVQLDLATRTGSVPLVVIRGDKEQTLQMTLK